MFTLEETRMRYQELLDEAERERKVRHQPGLLQTLINRVTKRRSDK